jgi:putative transposase
MLSHQDAVRHVCRVLGDARSHSYDQAHPGDETTLNAALARLAGQWPTDGYRRITALWRREDLQVNHQPGARLMRIMGLQGHRPAPRPRTTCRHHVYPRDQNLVQGLTVVRPDHVWGAEITSIRVPQAFVYLAVWMAVYTRRIRGWHLRRPLDQALTWTALRRALAEHRPAIHHADQGVQYAGTASINAVRDVGAHISMATVGEPTANGDAERRMRPMKEAEGRLHAYADFHAASQPMGRFLDEVYQHKRLHSALGDLTPAEFETQWLPQRRMALSDTLAMP